jgi:hypothetical protein
MSLPSSPTRSARLPATPVVLITRTRCHLCEVVRPVLADEVAAAGLTWAEITLDERPDLEADYGEMVPVTIIDGAVHDYWRLDRDRLRIALANRT